MNASRSVWWYVNNLYYASSAEIPHFLAGSQGSLDCSWVFSIHSLNILPRFLCFLSGSNSDQCSSCLVSLVPLVSLVSLLTSRLSRAVGLNWQGGADGLPSLCGRTEDRQTAATSPPVIILEWVEGRGQLGLEVLIVMFKV